MDDRAQSALFAFCAHATRAQRRSVEERELEVVRGFTAWDQADSSFSRALALMSAGTRADERATRLYRRWIKIGGLSGTAYDCERIVRSVALLAAGPPVRR